MKNSIDSTTHHITVLRALLQALAVVGVLLDAGVAALAGGGSAVVDSTALVVVGDGACGAAGCCG